MFDLLTAYIASLALFLLLDLAWITIIASNFYKRNIGELLSESPKLIPAIVFYTVYIAIMFYLIIQPSVMKNNLIEAAIGGALFGVVGYGTYSVTNYAIIKNWSYCVTVIDIIWGAFISAFASIVGFMLLS
jgi:uncharacterized membrane protein